MTSSDAPAVAVVVAAGSGSRLGAAVPKALVELEGVALVRRAVDALTEAGICEIVVTIPEGLAGEFAVALAGADGRVASVVGGATRQDSVRLGLAALTAPADAIVLVHDAARSLVPADTVRGVVAAVRDGADCVIPVIPVVDSVRRVTGPGNEVVDRADLRAVQTPQAARLRVLRDAHALVERDGVDVTDDATVCEYAGLRVTLVPGHRDALKITEPIDLVLARAILEQRRQS